MPGSRLIKQVHPRYRTPVNSIIITSVLAVALCLWSAGYWVVTSISTIALYLAYMFPVYLNWRNKRRGRGEFTTEATAPWSLGEWGPLVNAICIGWCLFLAVIFSLPPNELVLWTMLGLSAVMVVYWQAHAKRNFQGPTRADESALRSMEQQVGQAQAVAGT
jgi:amino acid transporter